MKCCPRDFHRKVVTDSFNDCGCERESLLVEEPFVAQAIQRRANDESQFRSLDCFIRHMFGFCLPIKQTAPKKIPI
jgi:hypothetical protein